MNNEEIKNLPIKWKVRGAGFLMQGVFVALADRDSDPFDCVEHIDTDVECYETWNTVWILEGDTLEEARKSLEEHRFCGSCYHVSDCELLDDKPKARE